MSVALALEAVSSWLSLHVALRESTPALLWLFPVFFYLVIIKVGHNLGKHVNSKADS